MCIFSYCCLATASIMAEAVFEKDWSDKMSSIIQQKCALSESCHGCVKWEGAVFQPGWVWEDSRSNERQEKEVLSCPPACLHDTE